MTEKCCHWTITARHCDAVQTCADFSAEVICEHINMPDLHVPDNFFPPSQSVLSLSSPGIHLFTSQAAHFLQLPLWTVSTPTVPQVKETGALLSQFSVSGHLSRFIALTCLFSSPVSSKLCKSPLCTWWILWEESVYFLMRLVYIADRKKKKGEK